MWDFHFRGHAWHLECSVSGARLEEPHSDKLVLAAMLTCLQHLNPGKNNFSPAGVHTKTFKNALKGQPIRASSVKLLLSSELPGGYGRFKNGMDAVCTWRSGPISLANATVCIEDQNFDSPPKKDVVLYLASRIAPSFYKAYDGYLATSVLEDAADRLRVYVQQNSRLRRYVLPHEWF